MAKTKSLPWFCFHTDWRVNPKVRTMPDSLQLRYIELMCLRREGFYPCSDEELAYHFRTTVEDVVEIKSALTAKRLLEASGDIHDWDDRQVKDYTSTDRVRKHREKEKERSSNVTVKQVETPYITVQDSTVQNKTDKKAGKPAGVSAKLKQEAKRVLDHLNHKTGKTFKLTKNIEACLKREGCTVADCCRVIDFKVNQWKGTEMERNINVTTPFRAANFPVYLDEAMAGSGSVASSDTRPRGEDGRVIQQWELDMMAETEQEQK